MKSKRSIFFAAALAATLGAASALHAADSPIAAAPASAPATPPPPGWAPGSNAPVAGITPILMNLWPNDPPNMVQGAKPDRDDGTGRIWDVNVPGVIVYLPPLPADKRPAGGMPALVACMGGSYTHLTRLVGADSTVQTLSPKGFAIISLKYRLKPPSTDVERDALLDGKRAIRLVRAHAAEWGIDPHRVGMVGWSAGGNLILNLATHFDMGDEKAADPIERQSCRPDFVAMLSPWPNARPITNYPPAKNAPPAFIGCAEDDRTAPFPFAQSILAAWQQAGAPAELVSVPTGGHGAFEIGTGTASEWPAKFLPWLQKQGLYKE